MLKDAGITDDATVNAFLAVANNESVTPRMQKLINRATDDFDSMHGRVKAYETKEQQYQSWYQNANAQYEQAMAELTAYRNGGGSAAGEPPPVDLSKYLTKEDLLKQLQERDSRYAGTLKDIAKITSRHASKYGEELDVDTLEKIAVENNLPLQAAYDRYIAPREEDRRNRDFEAKLKAAKEEGARDALSRHKLPVDPVPSEQSLLYHRPAESDIPKDVDADLLSTWHGVGKQ